MELIIQNISKYVSLTEEEINIVLSHTEQKSFKSKSIILNAGEVCKNSYFVNKGALRSFMITDNIHEHVLHFACESWWISDIYSLITQKPGNLFIEVLEDAELVILSRENQEKLYTIIPKLERFFRILTEKSLVTHQERIMNNLMLPAEERYELFCKKYPTLIQKVTQKNIASYIGVTPEFFSKMRAKMVKK